MITRTDVAPPATMTTPNDVTLVRVFEMLVERLGTVERGNEELRAALAHRDNIAEKGAVISGNLHGAPGVRVIKHYAEPVCKITVQWRTQEGLPLKWFPTPEWASGPRAGLPPCEGAHCAAIDAHVRAALGQPRYDQLRDACRALFEAGGDDDDIDRQGMQVLPLPDAWYKGLRTPFGPLCKTVPLFDFALHLAARGECPDVKAFGMLDDFVAQIVVQKDRPCTVQDALTAMARVANLLDLGPDPAASVELFEAPTDEPEARMYKAMLFGWRKHLKEEWACCREWERANLLQLWKDASTDAHSVWRCADHYSLQKLG